MTSSRRPIRPIISVAAVFAATATFGATQSRSPADMPDAILNAEISRPTRPVKPLWIASISPSGDIAATGTLRELIQTAYRRNLLDRPRVEGGPSWIGSDLFSIGWRVPGSDIVGNDGFPREAMASLQELLSWRFKLSIHTEQRSMSDDRCQRR